MKDFQEFISGKYLVVSAESDKEFDIFLSICENKKIKWAGGLDATQFNPGKDCGIRYSDSFLVYFGLSKYISDGDLVIPVSEFFQQHLTIEIFQSKQTVVCLKKQDGKVIARGVARCSKDDEFNFDYGAELAYKRMLDSLNKDKPFKNDRTQCDFVIKLPKIKILKDGTKIIKQDKYEAGDKVLIKNKWKSKNHVSEMDNMLNKIVDITGISKTGSKAYIIYQDFGKWDWEHKDIKGKVIE